MHLTSPMRCLPVLVLVLLSVALAAAQGTGDPGGQARRILADPAYQQERPSMHPNGEGDGEQSGGFGFPGYRQRRAGREQSEPVRAEDQPLPEQQPPIKTEGVAGMLAALSSVAFQLLFWVLLAVVAAVVVVWLLREVTTMRRQPRRKRSRHGYTTASGESPVLPIARLSRADELARQGAYGEAVHLLLLHALRRLDTSRVVSVAASTTSREVIGALASSSRLRPHLLVLVQAVERFLFAGTLLDGNDYGRCREAFEQLSVGEQP